MVASIFHELLETKYHGVFEHVVFAIPDSASVNYNAFRYVFEKQGLYENKQVLKKYEVPFIDPLKNEVEIFHIKAVDKIEAMKATAFLIEARGVHCDENILDYIFEVNDKSYITVEEVIKMCS